MPEDIAYGTASSDGPVRAFSMSIFADRLYLRDALHEDAVLAGLRIAVCGPFSSLYGLEDHAPGDIIFADCPALDAAGMAALSRLDMQAAQRGTQLVVSTSMAALDDVFACLDRSGAQLMVDPGRAEVLIALGRCLSAVTGGRVRELSEEDRLALLRLTEQVVQIAERLDRMSGPDGVAFGAGGSAFRFAAPGQDFNGPPSADGDGGDRLVRATRPALPDPRLVRRIIRQRQLRGRFFDAELFADPAWDMLLDLTAARAEHLRVSVTSLCIASGVPPTTALRWIGQLTDAGLLERVEDDTDRRRAFIALTDKAADAMARYFHELGRNPGRLM